MDTYKAEGIILQTNDFGDANRVITIFTKEFGKIDANAYGCRRTKNPMSGAMQMFNHVAVELSKGNKVDTIRDADVINFYGNLTTDLERLAYASLLFEIVNRMTLPRQQEIPVFDLLKNFLPVLNERNPRIAALIGICQFMKLSGIQLNFTECVHCGKKISGDAFISLIDGGAICPDCLQISTEATNYPEFLRTTFEIMLAFDGQAKLFFKPRQISAAERFFLNYVQSVLGKELNSVKFIRQIQNF